MKAVRWILGATLVVFGLSACGSSGDGPTSRSRKDKVTDLRMGYFPNVTHAPAVYGVESGSFARKLGSAVSLSTQTFTAGPAAVEALFSESIDAAFVGPNPAINAYTKSGGDAIRVVAGVASGGAFLVVKPSIKSSADLKGKKIASPQLSGTQDVALRWYLRGHGYATDSSGGGDVSVVPQENSQTIDTFKSGDIDGAWVPEPWATRLVNEAGARILVDERNEWPNKTFATTVLMVSTKFLKEHPDAVKSLVEATADAIDAISADPVVTGKVVGAGIKRITSKAIEDSLVQSSFKSIIFTLDPIASSLVAVAEHSVVLGLSKNADLDGIFDLAIVNGVLKARGRAEVSGR